MNMPTNPDLQLQIDCFIQLLATFSLTNGMDHQAQIDLLWGAAGDAALKIQRARLAERAVPE